MTITSYPVPCDTWLPTLADIEHYKTLTGHIGAYYNRFGIDHVNVDSDRYPEITSHWEDICDHFLEEYAMRMIGQETMERWQLRLQNTFDTVAPRFERLYVLYAYADSLTAEHGIPGTLSIYSESSEEGGEDSVTTEAASTTKNIDTPDQAINQNDSYADSLSKSTDNRATDTEYGHTVSREGRRHDRTTGSAILKEINEQGDIYRNVDDLFVREFDKCFLGVY